MTGLLGRVGALFLETAPAPQAPPPHVPEAGPAPAGAVVVGAPALVVAVAAACAGELRARARAGAALLCVWRPATAAPADAPAPAAPSPAGATTPGAGRLAARLAAHELPASACGRLAWLRLDPDPAAAARQVQACRRVADAPLVLAIAGPRPAELEPLLAGFDVGVAVLPADAEPALRELALARLPARSNVIVAPLAAGPPRWAALAGLARMRSLPGARS